MSKEHPPSKHRMGAFAGQSFDALRQILAQLETTESNYNKRAFCNLEKKNASV
jgi:hypothetical protein